MISMAIRKQEISFVVLNLVLQAHQSCNFLGSVKQRWISSMLVLGLSLHEKYGELIFIKKVLLFDLIFSCCNLMHVTCYSVYSEG